MERKYQSGNSKFFSYNFSSKDLDFIIDSYCNKSWGTTKIAQYFHVSPTTINSLLRRNGIQIRGNREKSLKYTCNEHYFDKIDSEHKAYWLGFIFADGYVSAPTNQSSGKFGLSIHIKDKELLELLKKDIEYSGPIHQYIQNTTYGETEYCRIVIPSNTLYNALVDKGVIPLKSLALQFPTTFRLPLHLQRHFIRGYFDGDGCITHNSSKKPQVVIKFCGTKEMLQVIQARLQVQHLKLEHKKELDNKNNYQLSIGGNEQAYRILDWMYAGSTIYLSRKYQIAQQLINKKEGKYE